VGVDGVKEGEEKSKEVLLGVALSGVKVGKDLTGVVVGVGTGVDEGVSAGVGVGVASLWACAAFFILFNICISKSSSCSAVRSGC